MPWEIILTALGSSSFVVIIAVVIFTNFGTSWMESRLRQRDDAFKSNLDLHSQIDVNLREKRIPVYEKLWELTGLLPKWPRADDVSYSKLANFSATLRDWYYKTGGMYLSENSRKVYGELQDAIRDMLLEEKVKASSGAPLTSEDYELIRGKCSNLRAAMTEDILSRIPPPRMS